MNNDTIEIVTSKGKEKVNVHEAYKRITTKYAEANVENLNKNIKLFEELGRKSSRASYVTASHENLDGKIVPCNHPRRKEEWICIETLKAGVKGFPFGELVDYQVPLKTPKSEDTNPEDNTGLGKIDLLAQKEKTVTLLELKIFESTEHPLKAFLEVYTYWKLLGGDQAQKFLECSKAQKATAMEKAVVFFKGSNIHQKLVNASDDMKAFLRKLNVKCYLADPPEKGGFVFKYAEEYKL